MLKSLIKTCALLVAVDAFNIVPTKIATRYRPVSQGGRLAAPTLAVASDNVLVMDHININHAKGRHDLLRAFYFDVLGLAVDPRKAENLDKGKKTLWANAGIAQFHLPEGSPSAQARSIPMRLCASNSRFFLFARALV